MTLVGTGLLAGFATLFQTGLSTDTQDRSVLVLLPLILGGWSVVIVAYGIVSTVSLAVANRQREIALLRAIGSTPRQVQVTIVVETLVVSVPVVLLGLFPGRALGALLLHRLTAAGMVRGPITLHAGWLAFGIGGGLSVTAAATGAYLAGRRISAVPPVLALALAADVPASTSTLVRSRAITGSVLVIIGSSLSISTLFMTNGPLLSSTAGPAGVAAAVGLALLSPIAISIVGRVTGALAGPIGRLAGRHLRVRAAKQAAVVGPLVMLVGVTTGTLYMQSTESTSPSTTFPRDGQGAALAPINYLVVVIIIFFVGISVTSSLVSATRHRHREFDLLRLTGASRKQVLALTTLEAALATFIATVLGAAAALATTIPFSMVRNGSPIAHGPLWIFPAIIAGTLAIALLATVPTAASLMRRSPAVQVRRSTT
ncbi:putative ABC transport system permease protein [Nakamurella sp. UYEF19]|uniref:FtsX-like permease family protein n=1 Tax=Nakamurella sp. UYEF19 TaxID=1756392 RepID=UPI003398AA00